MRRNGRCRMPRCLYLAVLLICVACAGPVVSARRPAAEASPSTPVAMSAVAAQPRLAVPVDRTVFTSTFGKDGAPVVGSATAQISGSLPEDWRDDSGWADLQVVYGIREEDGIRFLTARVQRIGRGFAQLARLLPDDAGERIYRLTARLRVTPGADVSIGIRQRGAPHRMLAACSPTAVGGWQNLEQDLVVSRVAGEQVGVWIQIRGVGSLDLAELALTERDPAAIEAERTARCGGIASPNLVRLSRFPLGLPSGWLLDRTVSDGDVAEIGIGPAGPSGVPSLRLATPVHTRLVTAPFDCAKAGMPHRASFSAAGGWRGRIEVLEGARVLAAVDLRTGAEWSRTGIVFTPVALGASHVHALRFAGQGELLLDALQVTAGDVERPYAAQRGAEVQLALPAGEAAFGHSQFLDEAPRVRWCATGAPRGAALRIIAHDQDGCDWPVAPIRLSGSQLEQGEALLPIPADRRAALRVEARIAEDGPSDELVVLRLPRPRAWGVDAPASPFGVHVLSVNRHLTMVKALGYNWVRLHDAGFEYTGWWWLEQHQGSMAFRDDAIRRYRDHRLTILGQLGTAPEWASYASRFAGHTIDGYFRRYFQPLSHEAFAAYVGAVTSHHRDDIRHWFVWNEPWIGAWWAVGHENRPAGERYISSAEPQRDFARLMETAHSAAKAVDPGLTVIGVNSTSSAADHDSGREVRFSGTNWTAGVVAAGGLDSCDAMDFHCYTGGSADGIIAAVADGFQVAVGPACGPDGRPRRPVWLTEGAPSMPPEDTRDGGYLHVVLDRRVPDPAPLAQRLVRWELGSIAAGCERSFLYSTHCIVGLQEWPGWAALVAGDGTPHPAALAVASFHHLVEGLAYVGARELAPGTVVYRFANGGREAAMIVDRADGTDPDLRGLRTAGVVLRDLWGNPVDSLADGGIALLDGAIP